MKPPRPRALLAGLMVVILAVCSALSAEEATQATSTDWPWFRGTNRDGTFEGSKLLGQDVFGIEKVFSQPLGSGYSGFSVAGDRCVTLFSDGTHDVIGAFDVASGKELWRHPFAPTYKGHSGSSDGPTSTPAIARGTVFGFGASGHLFAVSLADGKCLWSRDLGTEKSARPPHYGYATSPLIVGDLVVIQPGGKDGNSIAAFDRRTGEPRWSVGDDTVSYQSPTLMTFSGKKQIVALTDTLLLGINPDTGKILWQHEHKSRAFEAFSQPLQIENHRILMNSFEDVVLFDVKKNEEGGLLLEEAWRTRLLQQSYAIPVVHDGHIFGFNRKIMVCLDLETGKPAWRSREAGARGAILVDGRLVLMNAKGDLVIAKASKDGYEELSRTSLLGEDTFTPPTFAHGRIFVRGIKSYACARVTAHSTLQAEKEKEEPYLLGSLADEMTRIEESTDPGSAVSSFLEKTRAFPILEGDDLVHFVYQGTAEDVALAGNFHDPESELPLRRIGKTDLFARSLTLDTEAVWEYNFILDFGEKRITDPMNPLSVLSMFGPPASELRMKGFKVPVYDREATGKKGRIDSFQIRSKHREGERRVRLYVPPGYDESGDHRYPLLVVAHGDKALDVGHMDWALDHLIKAKAINPPLVVFLSATFDEYGGEGLNGLLQLIATELMPFVDTNYRTRSELSHRGIYGPLDGATVAALAPFDIPGSFGKVAIQSPYFNPLMLSRMLEKIQASQKTDHWFWVEKRRFDMWYGAEISTTKDANRLLEALDEAGIPAQRPEVAGSWGWSSWRASFGPMLKEMFPPSLDG